MTQQVEAATVIGTITGSGNATVIVTSAYITDSPKTVSVPVTNGDTASVVAGLIRAALAIDEDVAAIFLVGGSGADVSLTKHVAAANDSTLNISIDNGTCAGLTAAPTSTNTTAGSGISNAYATLAEYKYWIASRGQAGVVTADVPDDDMIEKLLEGVSRYIDRRTGRRFYLNSVDETRYYTPEETESVKVDDLAEITSVSVDYSGSRSYTALTTSEYDPYPDNAPLDNMPYTSLISNPVNTGAYFPTIRRGVKIVGKFGWPSVPMDIKEITLAITQSIYARRSGQSSAGRITLTAGGVVIRPEEIPPFAQKLIDSYQKAT